MNWFDDYGFVIFSIIAQLLLWSYFFYLRYKGKDKESKAIRKYTLIILGICIVLYVAGLFPVSWKIDTFWLYALGLGLLIFPVLDWYTTKKALKKGGMEANPVMKFFIDRIGVENIIFITVPLVAMVSAQLLLGSVLRLSYIVFVFAYIFVIVNNIIVIKKLEKKDV